MNGSTRTKMKLEKEIQEELAYIIERAEELEAVSKGKYVVKDLSTALTYLRLTQTTIRNEHNRQRIIWVNNNV